MKILLSILILTSLTFGRETWTEHEKNTMHVGFSALASYSAFHFVDYFWPDAHLYKRIGVSFSLGLIPGIGKEFYDRRLGFDLSYSDLFYDSVGSAAGVYLAIRYPLRMS